jgi:hypothetical protein
MIGMAIIIANPLIPFWIGYPGGTLRVLRSMTDYWSYLGGVAPNIIIKNLLFIDRFWIIKILNIQNNVAYISSYIIILN